ncbi:DUF6053 domain-containing protein [Lysobacter enzymogenes]|uniref:DUF6053 domain-containing protein n=1 Tax=Lysobacter enzymogenes TaxID=69 RepID=UPI00339821B3
MGGPSGPTLLPPIAATGANSLGPEGPPTRTRSWPRLSSLFSFGRSRPLAAAGGPFDSGRYLT